VCVWCSCACVCVCLRAGCEERTEPELNEDGADKDEMISGARCGGLTSESGMKSCGRIASDRKQGAIWGVCYVCVFLSERGILSRIGKVRRTASNQQVLNIWTNATAFL